MEEPSKRWALRRLCALFESLTGTGVDSCKPNLLPIRELARRRPGSSRDGYPKGTNDRGDPGEVANSQGEQPARGKGGWFQAAGSV